MSQAFDLHDKFLDITFVNIALSLFLLSLSLYLVQKVYRLIGLNDPPLILSIISISLALIFLASFLSLDVLRIFSFYDESITFNVSVFKLQ